MRYVEDGHVNVKWFGAKGDGITDDWFAIQKSINFVIAHNDKFNKDIFPDGNYSIGQPLICYKWNGTYYAFFTITLEGESTFWGTSNTGSTISPTFKNAFALGIQRGKGCEVKHLKFQGLYNNPATDYAFFSQTFDQATDATCKDSLTAAYGGIMIDPFTLSTTLPGSGAYYTLLNFYRGLGGTGGSTGFVIEDCIVNNFIVGIATSINGVTQNAELGKIEKVQFTMNKLCISGGQNQEKMNVVEHIACWGGSHTIFATALYGQQTPGSWFIRDVNIAGQNNRFIYNNGGGYFTCFVDNVYAENLGRFGQMSGLGASVEHSTFDFAYPYDFGGMPDWVISAGLTFKNCNLRYYGTNFPLTITGMPHFENCNFNVVPIAIGPSSEINGKPSFVNCNVNGMALGLQGRNAYSKNANNLPTPYGNYDIFDSQEGGASKHESLNADGSAPYATLIKMTTTRAITVSGANREFKVPVSSFEAGWFAADNFMIFSPDGGATWQAAGLVTNVATDTITCRWASESLADGSYLFASYQPIYNKCTFIGDVAAGDNHITGIAVDWGNPANLIGTVIKMPNTVSSNVNEYAMVTNYAAGTITLNRAAYYTLNNYYFSNGTVKNFERSTVNGAGYDDVMLQKGGYVIDVNYPSALGRSEKFKVIRSGWLDPSTVGATDARRAMMRPVEPFVYSGNPEAASNMPAGSEIIDANTGSLYIKTTQDLTAYNGGSVGWVKSSSAGHDSTTMESVYAATTQHNIINQHIADSIALIRGMLNKFHSYVISKSGTVITATPNSASTLPVYSGTDAYTVIQAAIDTLTPNTGQGTGGGEIDIAAGTFTLSNSLVVDGWENASPYAQLTIRGTGFSTVLQTSVAGASAIIVKNRASVNITDMQLITLSSNSGPALWFSSAGTNENSTQKSYIGNLYLRTGSTVSPALYMQNFWGVQAGLLKVEALSYHGVILENNSSTLFYGNSLFGHLSVSAGANYAALLFTSTTSNRMINLVNINYFECSGSLYGIWTDYASNSTFGFVDIENCTYPISLATKNIPASSNVTKGFRFNAGYLLSANNSNAINIKCGNSANGNFFNLTLQGSNGKPIVDSMTYGIGNEYDVILDGSAQTLANIVLLTPFNTVLQARTPGNTTKFADSKLVRTQTGTSYTLNFNDNRSILELDNASPITLTIRTNANVNTGYPYEVDLVQKNTGKVTLSPEGGVTIRSIDGTLTSNGQYSVTRLVKAANDVWYAYGSGIAAPIDTTHGTGKLMSRFEYEQIAAQDKPMTYQNTGDGTPVVHVTESGDTAQFLTPKVDFNHIIKVVNGSFIISHPDAKEVGDSDYTVEPTDGMLIFQQPTAPRIFRLTQADSMQGKELILVFFVSNTSQWALSGSWKVPPVGSDTPPYTEDFVNSGIAAGVYRLKTVNDQGTWRWMAY